MKFCVTSSYPSSKLTQYSCEWHARSHRASVITAYKQANYIITEGWSARSPDLNMIEHAWNLLKRAVNARQPALNNLAEVSVAVQEEWNNLDRGS